MKSQCPLPPQILKCSIHIQRSIPPRRIRITPVIRPVCAADQHIFDIRRGHENLISFYQSPFHDLRTCPGCDRCRRTRPGHGHKAVPQSRSIHIHRRGTEIRLYLTGKCKSPARVQIQTAMRQNDLAFEVRTYLKNHPCAAVVNLGCGLDMSTISIKKL